MYPELKTSRVFCGPIPRRTTPGLTPVQSIIPERLNVPLPSCTTLLAGQAFIALLMEETVGAVSVV
jgi:hypothetical protein